MIKIQTPLKGSLKFTLLISRNFPKIQMWLIYLVHKAMALVLSIKKLLRTINMVNYMIHKNAFIFKTNLSLNDLCSKFQNRILARGSKRPPKDKILCQKLNLKKKKFSSKNCQKNIFLSTARTKTGLVGANFTSLLIARLT